MSLNEDVLSFMQFLGLTELTYLFIGLSQFPLHKNYNKMI